MKTPKYLSPSALTTWIKDPVKYYGQYLADNAPPRYPQTLPMAIGSAFDIMVKDAILGTESKDLLASKIDEEVRSEAIVHGKNVLTGYIACGAFDALIGLINRGTNVCLESKSDIVVVDGVPLLGIPDLTFTLGGYVVILDWKVNGVLSKVSPKAGYVKLHKPGHKNHGGCHKDVLPMAVTAAGGITVSSGGTFDDDWSRQLETYSLLLGGGPWIGAIDQVYNYDGIGCACHRVIGGGNSVIALYKELWSRVGTPGGHFFREISAAESAAKCAMLDKQGLIYTDDAKGAFLRSIR